MTIPRLVLLPGLDGTGRLFKPFVDAVDSQARTTVVDYASPEVSRYIDCRAVAERRLPQGEPFVLVGESFSGPVSICLAAARPPGLRGVVLVGSFVACPRRTLRWLSGLIAVLPTHHPRWAIDSLLLGDCGTPELRLLLLEAMGHVSPQAVRHRLGEVARVNVQRELAGLDVPILYLRGQQDRLVPSKCADGIARLGQRVDVIDVRAPHMILQCAPESCAELILKFAGRYASQ